MSPEYFTTLHHRRLFNEKQGLRSRKPRITAAETRRTDQATAFYPQRMAINSPTSGSRSVGMARLWTKSTEFVRGGPTCSPLLWRLVVDEPLLAAEHAENTAVIRHTHTRLYAPQLHSPHSFRIILRHLRAVPFHQLQTFHHLTNTAGSSSSTYVPQDPPSWA
jgi:hypothetical protein